MSSLKLLLHCENGHPPYLTPHLLTHYFPPTDPLISNHLILGIELRDCCVVPIYDAKPKKQKAKTKKQNTRPPNIQPSGFTFRGRNIHTYFHIPEGYCTLSIPSFQKNVSATNNELTLKTVHGCQKLSPTLYQRVIEDLDADGNVVLYDDTGSKHRKCIERTRSWMTQILSSAKEKGDGKWYAPIPGGDSVELREEFFEMMKQYMEKWKGLVLVGINLILDREKRKEIIKVCFKDNIPAEKQKVLLVAEDLRQVLDAVTCGVNVIGTDLMTKMTKMGKALMLDLYGWKKKDEEREDGTTNSPGLNEEEPATKRRKIQDTSLDDNNSPATSEGYLHLHHSAFSRDKSPILKNCSCFTCQNHMRAYVHHLINVKELLGEILIFVHNLHHFLKLLEEMEFAKGSGRLDEFCEFLENQLG